jgi:hypothetical protein
MAATVPATRTSPATPSTATVRLAIPTSYCQADCLTNVAEARPNDGDRQ